MISIFAPFDRLTQALLQRLRPLDFLAPLLLRLYLVPIFWMAGWHKLASFEDTVEWFGNAEWGLGLPFPWLMAALATGTELLGAILLLLGLGLRLIVLPLMGTMLVAALTVHWENGWLAIAEGGGLFSTDRTEAAVSSLNAAKELLRENGIYESLTQHGSLVVLNNGIEFAATYFIMLLSLFFLGAGRWISLDHWIAQRLSANRRNLNGFAASESRHPA